MYTLDRHFPEENKCQPYRPKQGSWVKVHQEYVYKNDGYFLNQLNLNC